jgi:signal transduction histidine kinase
VLEVREPLAAERRFSERTLLRAGTVAVAVLGVTGLLTVALGVLWVGRPMRALCAGAARIGRGDFGPVAVAGGDEFGELAAAMSDMANSLAEAGDRVRRETAQRLAALEQLRHADRLATVGRLAAGVAHELGTPLNVVWSLATMIERGEVAGAEVVESAKAIGEQAQQMTSIIRQLLDFARPRPPDQVLLDLGDVAARAVALLEVMAQKRGVTLAVECAAPAHARVDLSQLQQVFANLLVNAIQASRQGGVVTVRIGPAAPPPAADQAVARWLRIDVVDTGVGIDPEVLDRLFEPFFTTKGVGEGTGLGLSVSRGIVVENGGRIAVESTPGQGSTFSVWLPQAETP